MAVATLLVHVQMPDTYPACKPRKYWVMIHLNTLTSLLLPWQVSLKEILPRVESLDWNSLSCNLFDFGQCYLWTEHRYLCIKCVKTPGPLLFHGRDLGLGDWEMGILFSH